MTVAGVKPVETRALWAGLLAGPVAWCVQLQAVYALAAWHCDGGPGWALHLGSLACLLVAVGGTYQAWRNWRTVGGWPEGTDEPGVGRTRIMSVLGVMSGLLFSLVIVAQWLAVALLPCGAVVPTT